LINVKKITVGLVSC